MKSEIFYNISHIIAETIKYNFIVFNNSQAFKKAGVYSQPALFENVENINVIKFSVYALINFKHGS